MEREIYDERMERVENPDLTRGYLKNSVRTVRHEAVRGVKERGHYEVIARYANGGADVRWIVDEAGREAKDAWEEEIPIAVYVPYTQAELDAIEAKKNAPTIEMRVASLERTMEWLVQRMGVKTPGLEEIKLEVK